MQTYTPAQHIHTHELASTYQTLEVETVEALTRGASIMLEVNAH